ncbi:MAG: 4Fe-4S binding protein [Candidatus Aenigmatarchaeota archaeon]|nr:MAG: 4Fe-4S binding protein [Candidatus Aenigmarchaeota archaeon]
MIETDKKKCLRCSACVGVCPKSALTLKEHGIECDGEKCNNCRLCEAFCPMGAIRVVKK